MAWLLTPDFAPASASLRSLPAGMMVKSISYGSKDLLTVPLKLDGTEDVSEIRVMIEVP